MPSASDQSGIRDNNYCGNVGDFLKPHIAATLEDNLLEREELQDLIADDLRYRDRQLLRLKDEVLDLEDLAESISLTDFTLDDFRIDLLKYLETKPPTAATPPSTTACSRRRSSPLSPPSASGWPPASRLAAASRFPIRRTRPRTPPISSWSPGWSSKSHETQTRDSKENSHPW